MIAAWPVNYLRAVVPTAFLLFLLLVLCEDSLAIHEENLPILVDRIVDKSDAADFNASADDFHANSPVVLCPFLPSEFIWCEPPTTPSMQEIEALSKPGDAGSGASSGRGKASTSDSSETVGCRRWGGRRYEDVQRTPVWCHALRGIECRGNRTFLRGSVPCIKYSGHHFLTTLLYSLLLGFLGIDRFCLGHTGSAVGKLLTLGGLGVWWLVDIVLLIVGDLRPSDDSSWMPYY